MSSLKVVILQNIILYLSVNIVILERSVSIPLQLLYFLEVYSCSDTDCDYFHSCRYFLFWSHNNTLYTKSTTTKKICEINVLYTEVFNLYKD